LNTWNIPSASRAKYLGVIFNRKIICRLHTKMIEIRAFGAFIKV
jgi:hypothetical protein